METLKKFSMLKPVIDFVRKVEYGEKDRSIKIVTLKKKSDFEYLVVRQLVT